MAYSVKTSVGTQTGLTSTTACVLWPASVAYQVGFRASRGWAYATLSGSTFTFFQPTQWPSMPIAILSLSTETLAKSIVGAQVLIDDGSGTGTWRLGTVTSDGTTQQSSSGQSFPSTAPAAVPLPDNNQQTPPVGEKATLTGTASDGTLWFSIAQDPPNTYGGTWVAGAQTTAGALAVGTTAFVQISGQWQVVQL